MDFKWWKGIFPKFPYTNNHEANLDYFLSVFASIWNEWEELYNTLNSWKTDTEQDFETWKQNTINQIDTFENDLVAALEIWKSETGEDISEWENETLENLHTWKQDAERLFNQIYVAAQAAAGDAHDAQVAAETAQEAAENAQEGAETAENNIISHLNDIESNTDNIEKIMIMFNHIINREIIDKTIYPEISNILLNSGIWNSGEGSARSIIIEMPENVIAIEFNNIGDTSAYIAFFDTFNGAVYGETPDYSDNHTGRFNVENGQTYIFPVENDMNYVYMQTVTTGGVDINNILKFH